jgi:hypothetical protein
MGNTRLAQIGKNPDLVRGYHLRTNPEKTGRLAAESDGKAT